MVKVGILGTGFGKFHAELYKKINGFEIVSIFGRNSGTLNQIAKELKINTTTNIHEIINNPDIDLLDICLPTEFHAKYAIEGLKNNKHVFCETPVAFDVAEADEIKQASQRYGKSVFVDLFVKFSTPHNTAIKYAREEAFGKLLNMRSYNGTSPRWGDLGLKKNIESFHNHMIDFACEIVGMPKSVTASGMDFGGKSIVTSTLLTQNSYAILESTSCLPDSCPFTIGFELVFSDGIVRFDAIYGDYTKEEFIVFQNGKPTETLNLDMKDDYEETFKHVLQCIENETKSPVLDIEAGINQLKIKDMILTSIDKDF